MVTLGVIANWLVLTGGLFVLGALELGSHQRRAGVFLPIGSVLLTLVYFLGLRLGDMDSRAPTNAEQWLLLVGFTLVALGAIGLTRLGRTLSTRRIVTSSVNNHRSAAFRRIGPSK
jgi:CDP-diglyceride synthetase